MLSVSLIPSTLTVVARWEQSPGKRAKLDGDGRTFQEVSLERQKDAA